MSCTQAVATPHAHGRWSFYDLLDDYKVAKAEPAPPASTTAPDDETDTPRRIYSAPPGLRELQQEPIPITRPRSSTTINRRVRFADDGLVEVHTFLPVQTERERDGEATAPAEDVPREESEQGEEEEDGNANTFSRWIDRQRQIRQAPEQLHGLGLEFDLPLLPTPQLLSADNTMRSSSTYASMFPLTPSLSRSPDAGQASPSCGQSDSIGPATPLPSVSPPSGMIDDDDKKNPCDSRSRAGDRPGGKYEIRRSHTLGGYRWSIDRYPFPVGGGNDAASCSYWSPETSENEGEDADQGQGDAEDDTSDDEPARVVQAQSARMSTATIVSSISGGSQHGLDPLSPRLLGSPPLSIHRQNAMRTKHRRRGNVLPLSSPFTPANPAPTRPTTAESDSAVFSILRQESAIMHNAALHGAARRRRTVSAPRAS